MSERLERQSETNSEYSNSLAEDFEEEDEDDFEDEEEELDGEEVGEGGWKKRGFETIETRKGNNILVRKTLSD